ncbi:MAG: efflux RND transporter periplasmic adaptor subunit [Planctomycetota bacterium]
MRRILIVAAFAGVLGAQGMPPATVEVADVVMREVSAGRSFVGSIEPARTTTVGGETDGLVVEFAAREGQRVEKGAVLAQLRTRSLEDRVAAAKAEFALRKHALAELKNGVREEDKDIARARVAQAEAAVEYRKWKVENAKRLLATKTVSEDEKKDADLALRTADAMLAERQAQLALAIAGPRKERIQQAESKLRVQEAIVRALEDELDRRTIRAPFAGYVTKEHTQVGGWLKRGDPVVTLVELDEVDIVVPVLEDFIGGAKVGLPVEITVDALPGEALKGKITAIVPRADPRSRTFPVKIRIKNRSNGGTVQLKAGMFARVKAAVGSNVKAPLVPKDAVVLGGPMGPMVYVVDLKTSTAQPIPVKLGVAMDDMVVVAGPLQPGMKVVVRGNERLMPGAKVVVK